MVGKTAVKKVRAQVRAARKRAARDYASNRTRRNNVRPEAQSEAVRQMNAELAKLVGESPISKREIDDVEEEAFLDQVVGINAKAVARESGVDEGAARVVLDALVQAGTLALREDLHLVPVKPLQ